MTKGSRSSLGVRIISVGIIVIFLTTIANLIQNPHNSLSGLGYPTAFQGPKATFYGTQWNMYGSGNIRWSNYETHSGASAATFNTVLDFDPDGVSDWTPNIVGEMTSVYIPQQTVIGGIPSWLPIPWFNTQSYIQNPQHIYEWNVTTSNTTYMFYMEQWLLRYYVSFSAEWDGFVDSAGGIHGTEIPQIALNHLDNSYSDLQVWIEFDTEPTWYIQGQGTAYFCIAKVQLAETVRYEATTKQHGGIFDSNKGTKRSEVSVVPESQTSIEFISYNPFGTTDGSVSPNYFQGQMLNPQYFRNHTYMMLNFRKFGVYGGSSIPFTMLGWWVKGDTATFAFDVTVFVIGKWDVKDIQQNPDDYGRFQRTISATDFLSWLLSAQTLAWLIPVAIFVALLFFAPWVIIALIAMFRGGKK